MSVKNILVLITGGTLNMKIEGKKGLTPAPTKDLEEWLQNCGILQKQQHNQQSFALSGKENIVCTIVESTAGLVDSSNIQTKDWNAIAKQIEEKYEHYDGFVVIHGTDTMVYTASAFSFIFHNLQKSVVITGAQIPIYDIGSDGENNFKSAVYFAAFAAGRIAEVVICFNNKIFRGNRTAKIDCVRYDAYESPNYPVLATVDNEGRIEVRSDECIQPKRPAGKDKLELKCLSNEVCLLKLYPGITPTIVEKLMECHEGIVLETYGAGNAPLGLNKAFENIRGKVVVNVTQCLRGGVTMSYETGKALQDAGVIPCGDMTTSAAFTKLCYLLRNNKREDIAELMKRNFRGEITYVPRNRN